MENLILGAGLAGLGAAYASEFQYPIFEAEAFPGGLCSGFEIQGFRFDRGVHLSFTNSGVVRGVFDQIPYNSYHPYPRNWYYDRWIKHPVQNNLFPLPVEKKIRAVEAFLERPYQSESTNFKDWSISRYGTYISEEFSFLYNQKYWCEDLEKLGVSWVGNRIYQPSLHEVLAGSYTDKTANTYYAKEMRYPKEGGYCAFLTQMIRQGKIHLGKRTVRIDSENRIIYFGDGTSEQYRTAFCSIPLPEIIDLLDDVPTEVRKSAQKLNHTGMVLVSVGLKKEKILDDIWFYIYDPQNAPQGCSSMQFEIYFNGHDEPPGAEISIENTKFALKRLAEYDTLQIDPERDILFMDYRVQKYGNVLMYPENDRHSGAVKEYLKSIGIIPIGRFGEWEYLWSDQAFLSGYNGVRRLNEQERGENQCVIGL